MENTQSVTEKIWSRKPVREPRSQGKVITLSKFSELKRPSDKPKKILEINEAPECNRTLPRSRKEDNDEPRRSNLKSKKTNHLYEKNIVSTTKKDYDDPEINQTIEEWGVKPKQRRSQVENDSISNTNDKERETNNNAISNITRKVSFEENVRKKDFSHLFNDSVFEVPETTDDGTNELVEDDIFGFNDFHENSNENFIIETYNDDGRELIMVTIQITRRSLIGFDYAFHNDKLDNGTTTGPIPGFTDNVETISEYIEDNDTIHKSEFNQRAKSNLCQLLDAKKHGISTKIIQSNSTKEENNKGEFPMKLRRLPSRKLHENLEKREEGDNFNCFLDTPDRSENLEEVLDGQISNNEPETPTLLQTQSGNITYVIEEMIKTEMMYIRSLEMVVKCYIPYIREQTPPNLIEKALYIFGNIEKIYEEATKFAHLLKHNNGSVDSIAQIFIDLASILNLYLNYSKNKPTADVYMKEFDKVIKRRQQELDDKLGLASHLLTPIQRLGKYILMLENIQKELKKMNENSEKVNQAISNIRQVMRKGNDSITIDSIKGCPLDLALFGSFIMRDNFMMLKPKKMTTVVFLFDQVVVFTQGMAKNMEKFNYVDSIEMSDLSLVKYEEKECIFHLINFTKKKKVGSDLATYILEADSSKIKNDWTQAIEAKLWYQLEQAKSSKQQKEKNQEASYDLCMPYSDTEIIYEDAEFEPIYENTFNLAKGHKNERINLKLSLEDAPKNKTGIKDLIEDMVKSEEYYALELTKIVKNYMPYIHKIAPCELGVKVSLLFGNIEEIYEETLDILNLLREKHQQTRIIAANIAMIFINKSSTFQDSYTIYAQNYGLAKATYFEYFREVIQKSNEKFKNKDELDLQNALYLPVRRLEEYISFLQRIKNECQPSDSTIMIDIALKLMIKVNSKCDDSVATASRRFDKQLLPYTGSPIMKEEFLIKEPRNVIGTVFIFEEAIVFTRTLSDNPHIFEYMDSIRINELILENYSSENNMLHLRGRSEKFGTRLLNPYILEAKTMEIKLQWISKLKNMQIKQRAKDRQIKPADHKIKHRTDH